MRKILAILGVLLLGLGLAGMAKADYLINPGFETGDFTGWTSDIDFTKVADWDFTHDLTEYYAPSGTYFAVAEAGKGTWARTTIQQTVWLHPGQTVSGYALLDSWEDDRIDCYDVALISVNRGATSHWRWFRSTNALPPFGHTEWETWYFTSPDEGPWTIKCEIYNGGDNAWDSRVFFDIVPLPGAAWLLGSGLLGLIGIGRKFKS